MKQWRQARARRERAATANTLERLRADERLLQLEFELVRVYGLTLPPSDRPGDGIRRQSELRLLDQALGRLQSARHRAQLVHWSLRLLTWVCGGCLSDGVDPGCGGRVDGVRLPLGHDHHGDFDYLRPQLPERYPAPRITPTGEQTDRRSGKRLRDAEAHSLEIESTPAGAQRSCSAPD